MMNKKSMIFLGAVLILGGCTMAPTYNRPSAPVPEEWPQGPAYTEARAAQSAPVVRTLSRQEFFADEQLQALIELALENNRDLRLAALNVERARALYGIQKSELFPVLNAVGAGGKERRSADLISPGEPRTVEQYSAGLGIAAWGD